MSNTVMTLAETAKYLKLSEKTIHKLIRGKQIPCAKVANQWRFMRTLLDDWLMSQMQVIPQNDLSRLIEREYEYVPVSRLMDDNIITFDLKNGSKQFVLSQLVKLAQKQGLVKKAPDLISRLLDREGLASTGIGNHVALPHLRQPQADLIDGPNIVIGISREGIDFDSIDGKPVHAVFLILTDSEVVHVRVMAKLTGILRGKNAIKNLLACKSSMDIITCFLERENKILEKRSCYD